MKDPKKQKAKTYNRRKKEYEKMRAGNTRLHKQICSVNLQIEDYKKTLSLYWKNPYVLFKDKFRFTGIYLKHR